MRFIRRFPDHFPVIVDIVADDVLHVFRQSEIRVGRTIDQLLVEDVVRS